MSTLLVPDNRKTSQVLQDHYTVFQRSPNEIGIQLCNRNKRNSIFSFLVSMEHMLVDSPALRNVLLTIQRNSTWQP